MKILIRGREFPLYFSLRRFLKYSLVGSSTFLLDLLLLYLLIDVLHTHYLLAAAIAFFFAITINYYLSRKYVFHGTLRDVHEGYVIFVLIALVGLLLVVLGMYLLVSVFTIHYIAARVLVAGLVGLWNYIMNLFVNFEVSDHD